MIVLILFFFTIKNEQSSLVRPGSYLYILWVDVRICLTPQRSESLNMKNVEEKFVPGGEWPAHLQESVTDGAWSNIVQLQARDTSNDGTAQNRKMKPNPTYFVPILKKHVFLLLMHLGYDSGSTNTISSSRRSSKSKKCWCSDKNLTSYEALRADFLRKDHINWVW